MLAKPKRPYLIKNDAEFLQKFIKSDVQEEVDKALFIGNTSIPIKKGKDVLKGKRLEKYKVLSKNLSPSQNMCHYLGGNVIIGDNLGSLYIFNHQTKKQKSWNSFQSRII